MDQMIQRNRGPRRSASVPGDKPEAQRDQPQEARKNQHHQPPSAADPRTKAMTLKLTERDYTRLIRAGISPRRTNQDMMEEAVLKWLDANGF